VDDDTLPDVKIARQLFHLRNIGLVAENGLLASVRNIGYGSGAAGISKALYVRK
jgi:hypothetical protein